MGIRTLYPWHRWPLMVSSYTTGSARHVCTIAPDRVDSSWCTCRLNGNYKVNSFFGYNQCKWSVRWAESDVLRQTPEQVSRRRNTVNKHRTSVYLKMIEYNIASWQYLIFWRSVRADSTLPSDDLYELTVPYFLTICTSLLRIIKVRYSCETGF